MFLLDQLKNSSNIKILTKKSGRADIIIVNSLFILWVLCTSCHMAHWISIITEIPGRETILRDIPGKTGILGRYVMPRGIR